MSSKPAVTSRPIQPIPGRRARSYFLRVDGEDYPAKLIRGMAYRIATGTEVSPGEYSGGMETARFLMGLGLDVKSGQTPQSGAPPLADTGNLNDATTGDVGALTQDKKVAFAAARGHRPSAVAIPKGSGPSDQSPKSQKKALRLLLERELGRIQTEAHFGWLKVPGPDATEARLRSIFEALQDLRGFGEFATEGFPLGCDYFAPESRLLVEYDERQHFTAARRKALSLYPAELELAYDRAVWMSACTTINAHDPQPPYRDEQRAFYDSVRDLLAAENGYTVLRLRDGDVDWTKPGAISKLREVLRAINLADGAQEPVVRQ